MIDGPWKFDAEWSDHGKKVLRKDSRSDLVPARVIDSRPERSIHFIHNV